MSDLISRQAAIDCVNHMRFGMEKLAFDIVTTALLELPSAQTERKKGEWIKATGMMPPEFHGRHCCSECGNYANMEPPFGNREDLSKFCPNCGADMRGEEE